MQSSLTQSNVVRGRPFTSATSGKTSRRTTAPRASAQKSSDNHSNDVVMKTVSLCAAAQMAMFPGMALAAADKQPPPIEATTDVGEAVQGQVPKGAANPKTREERNTSRDQKLEAKLNTIKDRFDVDKIMQGANTGDIFYGNGKNKPVSYSWSAPGLSSNSLQVNVNEQLSQAAGDAAASAGQKVKSATTNDPLAAAKSAASDVASSAKKATQGIDTKPVSFHGGNLQVLVANNPGNQFGAAGDAVADAAEKFKAAGQGTPADTAKRTASEATDAAKKATSGIDTKPVSFYGHSLQVGVANNQYGAAGEALSDAGGKAKAAVSSNPADTAKRTASEATDAAKKATSGIDTKPVAFFGDDLQVNVNEDLSKAAGDAAAAAGQKAKSATTNDPLAAAKSAASDVAASAKKATQGIDTKPVSFYGGNLQVSIANNPNNQYGAAGEALSDAGDKAKAAGSSNPVDTAKRVASEAADAAKKATSGIATKPVSFCGGDLQVNVANNPSNQYGAAGEALADAGDKFKAAGQGTPADTAKRTASEATESAKKATSGIDTKPVSYYGSSLQVNVDEDLGKAASDAASSAGQKAKSATTNDPLAAVKSAASDVAASAKKATQGIDTKPVSFNGGDLQVSIASNPNNQYGAAGEALSDAGDKAKAAISSNPADTAKRTASEATDAAKKATSGIDTKPVSFFGSNLQVNVNEDLSKAASDAASSAGQKAKSATTNDPLAAAKSAASDVAASAKKATQGIDTKPISFSGGDLQINVANNQYGAAGEALSDAGDKAKAAASSNPAETAKRTASEVADAAKRATSGIDTKPVSFSGSNLQVNANEDLSKAASDAAAAAGQKAKSATTNDPLAAAKSAASDVAASAKKTTQSIDTKPVSFYGSDLQVDVANQVDVAVNPVEQTQGAAQEAAAAVKSQTGGNPLEALKNKINEASVTNDSPQVQIEKGEEKLKARDAKMQQLTSSSPYGKHLQKNVLFTPAAQMFMVAEMAESGRASLQQPQGNGGGVTQSGTESYSSGQGNAVQGGDLKDSQNNGMAAQNKTSDLGLTAAQQDATPRMGPKKTSGLPSVLGGDSLVRDDSETPEDVAKGNLAKARQSNGNALDTLKSKLGV